MPTSYAACDGEKPPRQVFVTHGEGVASDTLRRIVQNGLGLAAHVPEHGETILLV